MKLTYYGTAAAEGMPALFCYCDHCERARKAGGKNIRTRCQALINDDLLLDFPPDTYLHILNYGLDLRSVTDVLLTHAHPDHLYSPEFENVRPPYAVRQPGAKPVTVYASPASADILLRDLDDERTINEGYVKIKKVEKFKPFTVGKYTVTALKADHAKQLDPQLYSVSDGTSSLLYAHDTGWFPPETWDYLTTNKPYFNFVSLDCTCTSDLNDHAGNHMNLNACSLVRKTLLELGCADEKTLFCLHHFSHNGGYTYDELVPVAKKLGFLVSYDSMKIEF